MKKYFVHMSFIVLLSLSGCKSSQEVNLIKEPEIRIYQTFDEEKEDLYISDYTQVNVEMLKDFYYNQLDYVIEEEELRKSIQIQSNEDVIISFNPVIDSVSLNNSYIMLIKDHYIKALASNPSKYVIPKTFDVDKIISLNEQEKLNNDLLEKMSRKGKAKIVETKLYFDTQNKGMLIYTVKVDVATSDYTYGKISIYDGFSGKLID